MWGLTNEYCEIRKYPHSWEARSYRISHTFCHRFAWRSMHTVLYYHTVLDFQFSTAKGHSVAEHNTHILVGCREDRIGRGCSFISIILFMLYFGYRELNLTVSNCIFHLKKIFKSTLDFAIYISLFLNSPFEVSSFSSKRNGQPEL